MRTLEEAALDASTCTKCRLWQGRTQVVYGVGDPDADLMFIGEAPGFHEDRQGEPFVGAAGQLLNQLLAEIEVPRGDVYINNVILCLRYNALIQLGDGSWERIGRLVRSRYDGDVMSVDEHGHLVPRRVVGWHASPLAGRRVLHITYRTAKRAGGGRVSIQLTEDHPVLTARGYVEAGRLRSDDLIATGQGLTDLEADVICGTLLGDGHISAKSSHLSFSHGVRQADYARFKMSQLEHLKPRMTWVFNALVPGGPKDHPMIHARTRAHRALGFLRREFYAPEKRAPFWLAHALSPRMLAFWFMDDGHTRVRAGKRPLSEIATNGFSDEDRSILLLALAGLGLPAKSSRGRICFDVPSSRELSALIAPFVPPSMRYKLDPEVEGSVSFDSSMFMHGPRNVMYDDFDITDVTDHVRTDTTFFCIDVEDTHNFVTAGGVVHNCRPPGNRDPLPDELDACKPWLDERIAIIDPAVVVTLGNWATRHILGKQVSISRVRGQRFPWGGRTVIPTFHPAAVLHGGGQASNQMTALRADFQEIRRALAERPEPPEEQLGLF
jgi:uracil-DNA glycosylase